MRKLLLSSTALATAAALTAGVAVAEIDYSISGYKEFAYSSRSSQVAASHGTYMSTDSEIKFSFTNKTEDGLDIGFVTEVLTDAGDSVIDESSMSISGGFGKIVLGGNDSVMDNYGFEAEDAVTEQSSTAHTLSTIQTGNGPAAAFTATDNKIIAYHLPAMGNFTAGISYSDSGVANTAANAATDTTAYGFAYTADAGGNTITIAGAQATTQNATQDIEAQNISAKAVAGNVSFIIAKTTYEAADEGQNSTGGGVTYTMPGGMVIGAYTFSSDDSSDAGEEYRKSGVEVMYTVAAGLKAIVNIDDYDYKVGTESSTADSGTISKLTIQATF